MTDLNSIKRIGWSDGQFDAGTRWYGVTVPLRRDAARKTSYSAVCEPIVEGSPWYDTMTPEAIKIVAELYSMKGIVFVWVGTYGIEVQKTPVFSWNDYQHNILELLNQTLFDGTAEVVELGAPMPELVDKELFDGKPFV